DSKAITQLLRKIRALRREWGASTCDLLFAEILASGSIACFMRRIGLKDPGDADQRIEAILEHLRQHGVTHLTRTLARSSEQVACDPEEEHSPVETAVLRQIVSDDSGARKRGPDLEHESVSDYLYFGHGGSRPNN